jgi:hypothetical protein
MINPNKPKAIIDNDALVNLTKLHHLSIFDLLRNIYQQILIPVVVKYEYEKQIDKNPSSNFILHVSPENRYCKIHP